MCSDTYNIFTRIIYSFDLFIITVFVIVSDPEAARSGNSKITTTLGLVVHAAGNVGPVISAWQVYVLLCGSPSGMMETFGLCFWRWLFIKERKRQGELRIFPRINWELRWFMEFYLGREFYLLLFTFLFFPSERLCDAHSLTLQFLCWPL